MALCLLAAAAVAQLPEPALRVAEENAEIAARIAEAQAATERAVTEIASLLQARSDLAERMQRIERRVQIHALGGEFAQTLLEQRRRLPSDATFAVQQERREALVQATSDANLRAERRLDELADLDAAAAQELARPPSPVPLAGEAEAKAAVIVALAEQRELLVRLADRQQALLEALHKAGDAERDLAQAGEAARTRITRILFWIPAPPGNRTVSELAPALAWALSPANWRAAAGILATELSRGRLWAIIALLAVAALLALRGWLRRRLVRLSPAAVGYDHYRIRHAIAALAITAGLAAPAALAAWTAGSLLAAAPAAQPFTPALGSAFKLIAGLLLALAALGWILDRHGIAVSHLGWDQRVMTFATHTLRRFRLVFVPLIFLAALSVDDLVPFAVRESLGRVAFNLAMIALAILLVRTLRRRSPVVQGLFERTPGGWAARLHPLWLAALVAIPLALAALAAAGYFVAAGQLFVLIVRSLFLALGALLLYGLFALWVRLQRYHLARRRDEKEARAAMAVSEADAAGEAARVEAPRLDVVALGEQTQSLLNLCATLLLLGGLWWVWRDALPALAVVGDYPLWTYVATVDGAKVTQVLTVSGLFLALVVGVVTVVGLRNVGALLDIILLQRFDVQADATYAIKVVARYIVAGVGVLVASNLLNIPWSNVQWLIAALGVGLGFGLQEIVANFVSGLILLAERPIRIGDVVTVGDVWGTVSRIRARATVVVDFDNKEVIIPNKAFITDRVINWTLSNKTTRLLINVGVAYGSDIAAVQKVLLEAVQGVPDVLKDPQPSVVFTAFGDSSLDFEIRAFVDAFDKRLRVRHEIGLAVAGALAAHGLEIPFPQRDLHIRAAPGLVSRPNGDPGGQLV
jgi:potassium efflux system protein